MRTAFSETASALLEEDPLTAVVLADISADAFAKAAARHPDRVLNVGIREQLMVSVGGGLALAGLKPIMLTGYINGCAMGFRKGHGLRFDERIVAKNDFDIAAANAHRHRLCVKDCRYTFCQRETFTGVGGQAAYRTNETEKRDVALLQKKWGDIFAFGGHSGTRKRDYAGIQKITMNLPF